MLTEIDTTEYLQWLNVEKGRSAATVSAYRRDIDAFLSWLTKRETSVVDVTDGDLEAYVSHLRRTKKADTSVSRAVSSLRGWFGFLLDEHQIANDPTLRLKSAKRARSLPRPLPEDDVLRLLDGIDTREPLGLRDKALLELLYGTGARVSEAVGIQLQDLDFDEELIKVTGKGSKERLVPMGGVLRKALGAYLTPGGRSSLVSDKKTSRVFLNAKGTALSRQGVDLIVHRHALVAGIDHDRISAHVFRHSCATHMLAHGADIRVVQELLGHASISTTQLYTAVSVTSLQREYRSAHPRAHD
jgi:integrase/recombinase XerD